MYIGQPQKGPQKRPPARLLDRLHLPRRLLLLLCWLLCRLRRPRRLLRPRSLLLRLGQPQSLPAGALLLVFVCRV